MGYFLNVWFLALAISITAASRLDNSNSKSTILLPSVLPEDKLAECLLSIVREVGERITANIFIRIEAESPIIQQHFENTVVNFVTHNKQSAFELASEKNENYEIHFRMYFIDSLKSLKSSMQLQMEQRQKFPLKDHYYIIVLPKSISNLWITLKAIFDVCWNLSIINVNALVEDNNGTVTLYTYFPFNKESCKDSSPRILNQYVNGSFTLHKSIFIGKTKNFWNCPIKVLVWEELPYMKIKNGRMSGFDGLFFEQLAKMMNFSIEVLFSPEGVGKIFDNQTVSGGFKMLNDGIADLMIGDLVCTEIRQKFFASSQYNTYYKKLIFRKSISHSSLKTLVLPFDLCTWLVIFALLIAKWFARALWNKIPQRMGHRKDTYNWCVIVPFLVSCFILRSFYEGSLFKFRRNRPSEVLPNNIDEANQQGYKFMVTQSSYSLNSIIPELKDNMVVFDSAKLLDLFFENDGKYALLLSEQHMIIYSNGRQYFVAPEPLLAIITCIYLPKFSYMTTELNRRKEYLTTYGHINIIEKKFLDKYLVKKKPQSRESQQNFSIKQLQGAFQLYGILIGISSLVFALEVLSKRNTYLKKTIGVFEKKD